MGCVEEPGARALPERRSMVDVMRLMIATLVVAFLVLVDFAKYRGHHTSETVNFVWRQASVITR